MSTAHWKRKRQPTPVILPGKSYGQRSLVGYQPCSCKESDTTEHTHMPHCKRRCFTLGPLSGKHFCREWNQAKGASFGDQMASQLPGGGGGGWEDCWETRSRIQVSRLSNVRLPNAAYQQFWVLLRQESTWIMNKSYEYSLQEKAHMHKPMTFAHNFSDVTNSPKPVDGLWASWTVWRPQVKTHP